MEIVEIVFIIKSHFIRQDEMNGDAIMQVSIFKMSMVSSAVILKI